ncbi:MAG TPA: DNA translocase FtsK 4TM domain-containing protein [Bellilinea sp.]|nr:DNA translocase FtsK 4TM domain-containing protein [Bellilinea sp.]
MPTRSSRSSRTSRQTSSRGRTTSRRTSSKARSSGWSAISKETKLNILGGVLMLVGALVLVSMYSAKGTFNTWVDGLNKVAGVGTFVLPIMLLLIGLWLILKNFGRSPAITFQRALGAVLLYLNILAWVHYILGNTKELAEAGKGGGYIGYFISNGLATGLGSAGAVLVLFAWLLLAVIFTFNVSIPELYYTVRNALERRPSTGNAAPQRLSQVRVRPPREAELPPGELRGEFRPLTSSAKPIEAKPEPAVSDRPAFLSRKKDSAAEKPAKADVPAVKHVGPAQTQWVLPQPELILNPPGPASVQNSIDKERARLIETTLNSFGAPCHVVEISRGPTITRYGVEPDFIETRTGRTRVRVGKIAALADDLALALAAPRIRVQAPVPGKSFVGIEVPNTEISMVSMREVLESDSFQKMKSPLRFTLGKDVAGKPVSADLAAMPHLLVAGTTGSGKSVCVNSILTSLLVNNTPADLRMILVDPKRVELTGYNGIPHLLSPVVVEVNEVTGALSWLLREMDMRYQKFSSQGLRNIKEYNAKHAEHLPYLVTIIDELADLMMLAPDETERSITRLAQLARATGIHLILATQRPSVNVVTGLIKANFPARVAFAVASGMDSRVILDQPGAERLLGRGDMLFQAPDAPAPVRLQGVFVSDAEINKLTDYWREQAVQAKQTKPAVPEIEITETSLKSTFDESAADVKEKVSNVTKVITESSAEPDQKPLWSAEEKPSGDTMYDEAVDLVRREGRASITMLQRRLGVGYTRAARLIDTMEENGVISPTLPNSQVREVLDYGNTVPPADDGM